MRERIATRPAHFVWAPLGLPTGWKETGIGPLIFVLSIVLIALLLDRARSRR